MPYKEEETETVLPFRGGFRRGSWNARRALEQSLRLYLERPSGSWNRASGSPWNAR